MRHLPSETRAALYVACSVLAFAAVFLLVQTPHPHPRRSNLLSPEEICEGLRASLRPPSPGARYEPPSDHSRARAEEAASLLKRYCVDPVVARSPSRSVYELGAGRR